MPTITPDNSALDRPYPSDPAKRYRQNRVGQPTFPIARNSAVWTCTLNATGGFWLIQVLDSNQRAIKHAYVTADLFANPTGNAAALQTVLEGQVGAGNVTVTGEPGASGGGTPYVITFKGELAGQRILLGSSNALLSGGAATATCVETTPGGVTSPSVPIGPLLGTALDANPSNSPRRRENDAGFV